MATGRRCSTPTGWKATTPQAALAFVLQPGPATETIYQQRGWVPLVLGDNWPLAWLLDQLIGPLLPEIALEGEPPAWAAIPEGWSQVACLRMQLFLPEEGLLQAEAAVHVHLKPGGELQQLALRPGLNSWDLQWETESTPWLVPRNPLA